MDKHKAKTYSNTDRGGLSRAEVARILGITEEGVRLIEEMALRKMRLNKKLYEYVKEPCDTTVFRGLYET
jgi:DNA-directed RNA polymerase sigma subunit (sigma70/sigma32)